MLFLSYIVLISAAAASIAINFKNRIAVFIYISICAIFWSMTMRTAELNSDFTYYTTMMIQENVLVSVLSNVYEPVLYSYHWLIFSVVDSIYFSWVIGDLILLFIFYKAIIKLHNSLNIEDNNFDSTRFYPAIFLILLSSWPFFIGFNLTYRQFAASIIFLYALSSFKSNKLQGLIFYTITVFTHNAFAVMLPLFLFFSDNKYLRFASYLGSLLIPFALVAGSEFADYPYVGAVLVSLYPLSILFISLFVLILVNGKNIKISSELTLVFLYLPYISMISWIFLQNGQAERMGVLCMSILLPIVIIWVTGFVRNKYSALMAILLMSTLPIFGFYQSMLA
jgi:hypothetical protein